MFQHFDNYISIQLGGLVIWFHSFQNIILKGHPQASAAARSTHHMKKGLELQNGSSLFLVHLLPSVLCIGSVRDSSVSGIDAPGG